MKKRFSALTVVIIGFLMMAVGVGATAGFINWNGRDDYDATLKIFKDIEQGIISKDEAISSLQDKLDEKNANSIDKETIKSELESLIAGANKENGLGNKYPYILDKLNKYATDLESDSKLEPQDEGGKSDQLRQAEIDMEDVHNKAKELQSKMNENKPSSDPESEEQQ